MQSVVNKVGCSLAALLLSVACCLGPYAQAAYANAIAVQYVGAALASIIAVLGVSPKVNGNVDFTAIGEAYTSFVDGMAEAGADILKDNVAAWDKTLTEDIDWDNIGATISASTAELARMGEAGVIDLNALSMSGAFGLLPALLSLFMADYVAGSSIPDGIVSGQLDVDGISVPLHVMQGDNSTNIAGSLLPVSDSDVPILQFSYHDDLYAYVGNSSSGIDFKVFDLPASNLPYGIYLPSSPSYSLYKFVDGLWVKQSNYGLYQVIYELLGGNANWISLSSLVSVVDFLCLHQASWYSVKKGNDLLTSKAVGSLSWSSGTWTDNPDVNLGRDYWDDAKENKDILNPSAGASVIGADAVIDGDYIANRGSLGVITDWADINSWADALARAHAGVAEGALDGTISTTQTGTAVDVGTGELVTDTVGDLVKPGGNTSISPAMPGLFDGVINAVSDKFPFCIPGNLHKCLLALGAAPVAPSFDWTFPLHHVGLTDVTIHIDLAPFDQVAMILRVCLSVTMTIGLIFLSIRLLNMWGGH